MFNKLFQSAILFVFVVKCFGEGNVILLNLLDLDFCNNCSCAIHSSGMQSTTQDNSKIKF